MQTSFMEKLYQNKKLAGYTGSKEEFLKSMSYNWGGESGTGENKDGLGSIEFELAGGYFIPFEDGSFEHSEWMGEETTFITSTNYGPRQTGITGNGELIQKLKQYLSVFNAYSGFYINGEKLPATKPRMKQITMRGTDGRDYYATDYEWGGDSNGNNETIGYYAILSHRLDSDNNIIPSLGIYSRKLTTPSSIIRPYVVTKRLVPLDANLIGTKTLEELMTRNFISNINYILFANKDTDYKNFWDSFDSYLSQNYNLTKNS